MRDITYNKYLSIVEAILDSGLSVSKYCKNNNINAKNLSRTISKIKSDNKSDIRDKILNIWNNIVNKDVSTIQKVETDDRAETSYERDSEGKIKYYNYEIFKKKKRPLSGKLTREEMATIYRLYSYYGDSLTRRAISRYFPDLSLVDFKRILKAFNIYKDSSPFPPHYIEEYTEDELREIQLREKENSFLRKAEEDNIKNTEKLLRKYAQENIELKKKVSNLSNIKVTLPEITPKYIDYDYEECTAYNMNLYIADMHIGSIAYGVNGNMENIEYGSEEVNRRLQEVYKRIISLGYLNTLNIVLMGDNIDSCQFDGYTASMTHRMPENMSAIEQGNVFISSMITFIDNIVNSGYVGDIKVFSVPYGNHPGYYEFAWNKALMATIKAKYPDIETVLWDEAYGVFEQNGHTFICTHGKAVPFQKKPMPLNMDKNTQILLMDWLAEHNLLHVDNVHFVKGDLHSNNLNSCKRFDYRNVLSLYGSSDYSAINYVSNSYGASYDLFIGDNLIRGTFENI